MWRIIGLGRAERFHRALNRSPHMQGIEKEGTNRLEHIELHASDVRVREFRAMLGGNLQNHQNSAYQMNDLRSETWESMAQIFAFTPSLTPSYQCLLM